MPPSADADADAERDVERASAPESIADEVLAQLDALYGFARRLSGSNVEAEELVQETYARAFGAEARFVRGTNARAWLFRILRNVFLDERRREKRARIDDDERAIDEASNEAFSESIRGDVELERLRSIVAEDIERALLTLASEARLIILLDLQGFTERESAEVLGCAIGTVKSRLSRARAVLRERLRDYGGR